MPGKTFDEIEKENLVNEAIALRDKINKGISSENKNRKKEGKERVPMFTLTDVQIRKNVEAKYEIYKRCKNFLNENAQIEKDNKNYIAKNGDPSKKENLREPHFLDGNNFKAFNDNEFKDVVKQTNTPAKTRDFKMNLISSHVNSNHIDACRATANPDASLDYIINNQKQVYIGSDFSNVCKDSDKNKIDFTLSDKLNNEINNNKKYLEDPYKGILSQLNFNASAATFLFNKDSDITNKNAEAFKCGIGSMSFNDADTMEETEKLLNLKQLSSDISNITVEKRQEFENAAIELSNEQSPLKNTKEFLEPEKDKYLVDACKDRINNPSRSVPLTSNEYDQMKMKELGNKYNWKDAAADYFNYFTDAVDKEKVGDNEYEKKKKADDNIEFINQAVKDEDTLNNMSGPTKFFSGLTKPNEETKNCAYLKNKVAQDKKFIKDNNLNDAYENVFSNFQANKEKQKQQEKIKKETSASKEKQQELNANKNAPENMLNKILKTPASKGPNVMQNGDPEFNRAEAYERKKEMNRIYKKNGFFARQFSRLIPDFLLDFGPFRWIMRNLVPFGIGKSLLRSADARREIQKFNRKMDRGFLGNPLGKYNNDPNLTPEQKAVADYKANYKAILNDMYKTGSAGRFGSNFLPKSWTATGKCKLDMENNDQMLQEILGPLSKKQLNMMKNEVMQEYMKEQNPNLGNEKELEEQILDNSLEKEKTNELNKEKELENNKVIEEQKTETKDPNIKQNEEIKQDQNLDNTQIQKQPEEKNNNIVNEYSDEKNFKPQEKNIIDNNINVDENKNIQNQNIVNNEHKKPLLLNEINQINSSPNYLLAQDRGNGLELNKNHQKQGNIEFNKNNQL